MSNRKEALERFIDKYKHTAEQGSDQWLKDRLFRIGGSEISIVLKKNPYSNIKSLIKQHVGLSSFKGYPATWFGNLMEPILTDYINKFFNCIIQETGSINTDINLGYSPDGIAVVNKKYLNTILNDEHFEHIKNTTIFKELCEDILVLFEFKCPFKRIPHKTEIPEYYLPQPLLGMEIIDICEIGIFIEAIYRFCSFDDIQYNSVYNNDYHSDKIPIISNPLCYGFMVITYDKNLNDNYKNEDEYDFLDQLENKGQYIHDIEKYLENENDIKININNYYINDLGKIKNKWLFNQILEHIVSKKEFKYTYINHKVEHKFDQSVYDKSDTIKLLYNYDLKINLKNEIYELIQNIPENELIIGIIPYKLLDIYMKPVNKKINFITEEIQKKVDDIINVIKECYNGNKTNEEKEIIVNEYCDNNR